MACSEPIEPHLVPVQKPAATLVSNSPLFVWRGHVLEMLVVMLTGVMVTSAGWRGQSPLGALALWVQYVAQHLRNLLPLGMLLVCPGVAAMPTGSEYDQSCALTASGAMVMIAWVWLLDREMAALEDLLPHRSHRSLTRTCKATLRYVRMCPCLRIA